MDEKKNVYFLFIGIELYKLIAHVKYSVSSLILVFFSVFLTGVIKKLTFVIFSPISPYQLYYYLINLLFKRKPVSFVLLAQHEYGSSTGHERP